MKVLNINRLRPICLRNRSYRLPKLQEHGLYNFTSFITPNVKKNFKKRIIPISLISGVTGASYYFYNNYKNKQNNFLIVANNKSVKKESENSKKNANIPLSAASVTFPEEISKEKVLMLLWDHTYFPNDFLNDITGFPTEDDAKKALIDSHYIDYFYNKPIKTDFTYFDKTHKLASYYYDRDAGLDTMKQVAKEAFLQIELNDVINETKNIEFYLATSPLCNAREDLLDYTTFFDSFFYEVLKQKKIVTLTEFETLLTTCEKTFFKENPANLEKELDTVCPWCVRYNYIMHRWLGNEIKK